MKGCTSPESAPLQMPVPPASPSGMSDCSSHASVDGDVPTSERRHACPFPGCDQVFKRRYSLKDHVNSHTGDRPFVCPVRTCGRGFATSGNLGRHKRVVHPWLVKPLPCLVDGCACEFLSEAKLERHMQSHFDGYTGHRCTILSCGKVFSTPGNLRRHIKITHNVYHSRGSRPRSASSPTIVSDQKVHIESPEDSIESANGEIEPIAYDPNSHGQDNYEALLWLFYGDDTTEFVTV